MTYVYTKGYQNMIWMKAGKTTESEVNIFPTFKNIKYTISFHNLLN